MYVKNKTKYCIENDKAINLRLLKVYIFSFSLFSLSCRYFRNNYNLLLFMYMYIKAFISKILLLLQLKTPNIPLS